VITTADIFIGTILAQRKKRRQDEVLENSLAPNRIFNAISIRSSRRLRNSLRSDILADQKKGQSPFFHRVRKKGTVPFSAPFLLALEERTPMAKSSMVAAAIFQNLYENISVYYHGLGTAFYVGQVSFSLVELLRPNSKDSTKKI
jgi:hypothetical protein